MLAGTPVRSIAWFIGTTSCLPASLAGTFIKASPRFSFRYSSSTFWTVSDTLTAWQLETLYSPEYRKIHRGKLCFLNVIFLAFFKLIYMWFPEDQNYINSTKLHTIDSPWENNGNFFSKICLKGWEKIWKIDAFFGYRLRELSYNFHKPLYLTSFTQLSKILKTPFMPHRKQFFIIKYE